MVPRLWLVALVGLVACREPASDEGSPRVASLVPPRQPAPSPAPAAPSLLPKAPRPVTLQHAHVLAGQEHWPESAAVYSALVEADAADAQALAGRGYALSSWGDPRVIVQALDDLEQARTMTEDARLSSAIAFNLGNLHERLGHPHRAREQYEQALRLQSDGAIEHALNRVDEGAKHPYEGPTCTLSDPIPTSTATDWADALTQIRALQELPPLKHVDEARAQEELCGGACPSGGVVSPLGTRSIPGVDLEDTREAHVLLPMESRIVFIPRVALGMGTAARCPDEVVEASVDQWHGWSRARFSMLTNHLTECESEDEDECMSGCVWEARTDYVVLVSASGTTAAVFSANLAFREPNAEVPWEWLERYAVLPPGVLFANEEGLYVYGCGPTRAVRLPP